MEKEYLYLSHLATENGLRDFNMNIYQGEIICLLGLHGSGKGELRGVLEGRIPLRGGKIYFGAEAIGHYDEDEAYRRGIDCIDTKRRLVGSLSIADNIFALRRKGRHQGRYYDSRTIQHAARELLELVGLTYDPATPVYWLNLFEQQLVCIARALSHNSKILIIDGVATTLNYTEQNQLKALIARLAATRGISFLLLDDKPNEFLAAARKIVLIRKGRDIKTFFRPEITPFDQVAISRQVVSYLAGLPVLESEQTSKTGQEGKVLYLRSKKEIFPLYAKRIYGFFDIYWDAENSFLQYLQVIEGGKALYTADNCLLNCTTEEALRAQGAIYIPENSAELLIEPLSVTENLAVPNYRLLSRHGVLKKRMIQVLDQEFRSKFSIPEGRREIHSLNKLERKLLGIHRWMWRHPPILILENPLLDMDAASTGAMAQYLHGLTQEGALVLVTSKSLFELSQLCDHIICTTRGSFYRAYARESFGNIEPDLSSLNRPIMQEGGH